MHWDITEGKSLSLYTWKIHGACCICQYKDIISSKQGTITADLCSQNWHIGRFSPLLYERRHWAVKSNGIECSEKLNMTVDFTLTWIRAYFCFSITYLRVQPLWKIVISCRTDTRNVDVLKVTLTNGIFLRISKLNSLALPINNFNMLQNEFHDLHLIRNKMKRWYFFLFKFSSFGKIKSIDEFF